MGNRAIAIGVSHYSQKRGDYRLSKAQAEQAMVDAGGDGFWLLSQIERFGSAEWQDLPEIVSLRQVLEQQFDDGDGDGSSGVKTKANIDVKGE